MKEKLSITIAAKDEEDALPELYNQIISTLKTSGINNYEIVFVDDNSSDSTFDILNKFRKSNPNVKLTKMEVNVKKTMATIIGLQDCDGDYIMTMDADLQDVPSEIPKFMEKIKDYDGIFGWRYNRQDGLDKLIPSKIYNTILRAVTGVKIHDSNCGFKLFRKKAIKNIDIRKGEHRYISCILNWAGYKITDVKVVHAKRRFGKSKFMSPLRMVTGFFDLIKLYIRYKTNGVENFYGDKELKRSGIKFKIENGVKIGYRPSNTK